MSHIHIPDGVFPIWFWLAGFIITFIYMFIVLKKTSKTVINKKIPLIAILAALMVVTMSIHIFFPIYHITASAIVGIILGPVFSPITIFIVNSVLAFSGHGGVTTIGLNTIVLSTEAIVAYYLFNFIKIHNKKVFISAAVATFISLLLAVCMSIGVVFIGTKNLEVPCHHSKHEQNQSTDVHPEMDFNIERFIKLVLAFGFPGWLMEALITGFIINYIYKIKPSMIEVIK